MQEAGKSDKWEHDGQIEICGGGVERVVIDPEFDRVMVVGNMDVTSIIDCLIRKVKRKVEMCSARDNTL